MDYRLDLAEFDLDDGNSRKQLAWRLAWVLDRSKREDALTVLQCVLSLPDPSEKLRKQALDICRQLIVSTGEIRPRPTLENRAAAYETVFGKLDISQLNKELAAWIKQRKESLSSGDSR